MIETKLKILLVEDNPADVVLIERQIKKIVTHPEILNIDDIDKLAKTLREFVPDIILSDYKMDGFTGGDGEKRYVQVRRPATPAVRDPGHDR